MFHHVRSQTAMRAGTQKEWLRLPHFHRHFRLALLLPPALALRQARGQLLGQPAPLQRGRTGHQAQDVRVQAVKSLGVICAQLNLPIQVTANLPDVILLCEAERCLVVVEVVASSGPISASRMAQLDQLVQQPQALGYRLRYVTAFPNRRILRRFIEEIAWGTDVWVASEPEGVIRFGL